GGSSIQSWSRWHLPLGGTRERGIVDVDLLEESGRPGCRLDRFQDDGFTLASNGDDVPFELKSFGQFHQLSAVGPYDLGNFHGISHSEKEP
ncbi:MAG: hypothetical protein WB773_28355, partial [Isosphaeraceae bacterium]